MHVLYEAKDRFGQCRRGSKLGYGCVPGYHPRDDINGFKKRYNFHIPP